MSGEDSPEQPAALAAPGSGAAAASEAEEERIQITLSMLSGRTAGVALPPWSTLAELAASAATALELGGGVRLIVDGRAVEPAGRGAPSLASRLDEVGLARGGHVEVAVACGIRPMEVPSRFSLQLRARSQCRSSAFTVMYMMRFDVPESRAEVELWRKNDTDVLRFNTEKGILEGEKGHWMSGPAPFEKQLGFSRPMSELLADWIERSATVSDEADRFWKLPGEAAEPVPEEPQESPRPRARWASDSSDCRPNRHHPVPDWFVAPSSDCAELVVDAGLSFMMLLRVLLDAEGRPIRAALGGTGVPNHSAVEEYDVTLEVLAEEATAGSRSSCPSS